MFTWISNTYYFVLTVCDETWQALWKRLKSWARSRAA